MPTRLSQPPFARLIAAYSTSCTSVDLPDPLTPVTQVSVFSGIADVDVLQVVLGRAEQPDLLAACPRRRVVGTGIASSCRRYFDVSDRGSLHQAVERAREHDAPALLAGAEAEIDDVIGDLDHVGVVLDDEHRVALVAQLPQDVDQPQVVARVQADRRLVEHVQRADERRAERRRQVDALRLAARQRRRQPIERQVVEADVAQERQPAPDLLAAPSRRSPLPSRSARASRRTACASRTVSDDTDRSSGPTPARRALRAAAARRRSRDTSDSRDTGSGTRGRGPCTSSARASGRIRGCPVIGAVGAVGGAALDDEAASPRRSAPTTARRGGASASRAARFSSASCAR